MGQVIEQLAGAQEQQNEQNEQEPQQPEEVPVEVAGVVEQEVEVVE